MIFLIFICIKSKILANRLFCTFTEKDQLEYTLTHIKSNYHILYDKIFVLCSEQTPELICTYNPDCNNLNEAKIIKNTILLHRKKETNTLYSINCLNIILKQINNGIIDKNQKIDWEQYKNSILITRQGIFTQINTKIYTIHHLN